MLFPFNKMGQLSGFMNSGSLGCGFLLDFDRAVTLSRGAPFDANGSNQTLMAVKCFNRSVFYTLLSVLLCC